MRINNIPHLPFIYGRALPNNSSRDCAGRLDYKHSSTIAKISRIRHMKLYGAGELQRQYIFQLSYLMDEILKDVKQLVNIVDKTDDFPYLKDNQNHPATN